MRNASKGIWPLAIKTWKLTILHVVYITKRRIKINLLGFAIISQQRTIGLVCANQL